MDLIGIFHVVDMLSSGKHDINHIHFVGLIQSILIQFILIQFILIQFILIQFILIQFILILSLSLWCSSNVHVLVGLLSHECWLLLSFSYCVFFSDPRCCSVSSRYVCGSHLPFGFHG